MRGYNNIRNATKDPDRLQVQDVWLTVQGEGPYIGMHAIFIRLTGCNLKCHFCDTKWNDEDDRHMTAQDLLERVCDIAASVHYPVQLVVITGGEPLRQNLDKLARDLLANNFMIQVETAGTYWQDWLDCNGVTIVVSPKTQSVHPLIRENTHHWKYVIQAGEVDDGDGLPSVGTQRDLLDGRNSPQDRKGGPPMRPPARATVWLSPCDTGDYALNQANRHLVGKLALIHGYRPTLQAHKLWDLP